MAGIFSTILPSKYLPNWLSHSDLTLSQFDRFLLPPPVAEKHLKKEGKYDQ